MTDRIIRPGRCTAFSAVVAVLAGCFAVQAAGQHTAQYAAQYAADTRPGTAGVVSPSDPLDYTFSAWRNGRRKLPGVKTDDVLLFETGCYGLALDMARLDRPRFSRFDRALGYQAALEAGGDRTDDLSPAKLHLSLRADGKTYRAVRARAGEGAGKRSLDAAWLWEAGQIAQRYELRDLHFETEDGEALQAAANLHVTAWPTTLALQAEVYPSATYQDALVPGVTGAARLFIDEPITVPHAKALEPEQLSVEVWARVPERLAKANDRTWLISKNENEWTDSFYGLRVLYGQVSADMNFGGGRENHVSLRFDPESVKVGEWNHFAMTYDGEFMRCFVNGELERKKKVGKTRAAGEGVLRLARRADGKTAVFEGLLDDPRIWGRALSAREIKRHATDPTRLGSRDGMVFENTFGKKIDSSLEAPTWQDAQLEIVLETDDERWETAKTVPGDWRPGVRHTAELACHLEGDPQKDGVVLSATDAGGRDIPVRFEADRQCYVARVEDPQRHFQGGYVRIDDYDTFDITVENRGGELSRVPFLLDLYNPANVTGLVPILCDENGVPTGIPVQTSKNWHDTHQGNYLRAYALIPATPGKTRYQLRVVYGFYGGVPSASHAMLSLVGYAGHGQWDQLAIGTWGETFCLDIGMSLTDVAITDIRGLMLRDGVKGKKWNWTDAGWGGDWLRVQTPRGRKLSFAQMKSAYHAQGPCLTDVRYQGFYGTDEQVGVGARVQTLRTDDYARTFQQIEYDFKTDLPDPKGGNYLFQMGGKQNNINLVTPRVAYGNADGLIKEITMPADGKPGDLLLDRVQLTGKGPWWVAFPGAGNEPNRNLGTASKALIIRGYKARFGGVAASAPTLTVPIEVQREDGRLNANLLLVPPAGVTGFKRGDTVKMDLQWLTVPRQVEDYYGPNQALCEHLAEHPRSWQTIHREAAGNDLRVKARGGRVTRSYPIEIRARRPEVEVRIQGGVGYVPVTFTDLSTCAGYRLYQVVDGKPVEMDQAKHGNDFWQTQYDAESDTYAMTFNLPLDGVARSRWLLTRDKKTAAKP